MEPRCPGHNHPCIQRTVIKDGINKGRLFWVCSQVPQCQGSFQWADNVNTRAQSSTSSVLTPPQQPSTGPHSFSRGSSSFSPLANRLFANPNTSKTTAVSLEVVSQTHFASKCAPYDESIIRVYKSEQDRSYDSATHSWIFPLSRYSQLLQRLESLENVTVTPIPEAVLSGVCKRRPNITNLEELLDEIPCHLRDSLLPFQLSGVRYVLERGGRCLIGDEMGLGKTLQAIAVATVYRNDWPVLVICPSSIRFNWRQELQRWIPWLESADINVIVSGKGTAVRSGAKLTIMSYDLATKLCEDLLSANFGIVICDESHYLKNQTAKRTKATIPLIKKAQRVLLLTGTPALSRPSELYTQISALEPKLFPSFKQFGLRYCNAHQGKFGWDYSGASNLSELHFLLHSSIMIRRLKADVLTELPPKRRQQFFLDISARDKANVQHIMRQIRDLGDVDKMMEMTSDGDPSASADVNSLRKQLVVQAYTETARAKTKAVSEFVSELCDNGAKFLLFAHHQHLMDALQDTLLKSGTRFIRIDGKTPAETRHELATLFQTDDHCRVALLSITAAGTGLTLSAASTVVFAELCWTPGSLVQAEDRVHRIGQKMSVNITYLCATDTIDDFIWPLISKKLEVLGSTLNGAVDYLDVSTSRSNPNLLPPPSATRPSAPTIHSFFKPVSAPATTCTSSGQRSADDQDGRDTARSSPHTHTALPANAPSHSHHSHTPPSRQRHVASDTAHAMSSAASPAEVESNAPSSTAPGHHHVFDTAAASGPAFSPPPLPRPLSVRDTTSGGVGSTRARVHKRALSPHVHAALAATKLNASVSTNLPATFPPSSSPQSPSQPTKRIRCNTASDAALVASSQLAAAVPLVVDLEAGDLLADMCQGTPIAPAPASATASADSGRVSCLSPERVAESDSESEVLTAPRRRVTRRIIDEEDDETPLPLQPTRQEQPAHPPSPVLPIVASSTSTCASASHPPCVSVPHKAMDAVGKMAFRCDAQKGAPADASLHEQNGEKCRATCCAANSARSCCGHALGGAKHAECMQNEAVVAFNAALSPQCPWRTSSGLHHKRVFIPPPPSLWTPGLLYPVPEPPKQWNPEIPILVSVSLPSTCSGAIIIDAGAL